MPFMEGRGDRLMLESLGGVELESLQLGHNKKKKRLVAVAILADMEKSGRTLAVVVKDYTYIHMIKDVELPVTVPEGFVTDFASIPKAFQWLIHPFGSHAPAAVLHDYLYAIGQKRARRYADLLFLYAMQESGVRPWRAWTMFVMVKLFGGGGYGLKEDWAFADSETGEEVPDAGRPGKIDWASELLPQKKKKKQEKAGKAAGPEAA